MTDDYAPIVEEGHVERTSRWKAPLRAGRLGLPAVGTGRRIVIVDGGGVAHATRDETAGERQWRNARSWMVVDVSPHTLAFAVHVDSPFGHAGFDATIDVECRVSDPVAVADGRIDGIRDRLTPAFRTAARRVVRAAANAYRPPMDSAAEQLLDDRRHVRDLLDDELQAELNQHAPDWLATSVMSVTVEFDERTDQDYNTLREREQNRHVVRADAETERVRHEASEDLLDDRRKRMTPHLTGDTRTLLVEILLRDPTASRFDVILKELRDLNADEQRYQNEQFLQFVRNGLLDEYPELKDRVAKHFLDSIPDEPAGEAPLASGDEKKPELTTDDDPGTVDHEGEAKTEEHRPEDEPEEDES